MTPLEQFDKEEMERLAIELKDVHLEPYVNLIDSRENMYIFESFIKSHDARRDAARREELMARIEKMRDLLGQNLDDIALTRKTSVNGVLIQTYDSNVLSAFIEGEITSLIHDIWT